MSDMRSEIRSAELKTIISRLKAGIKSECQKIIDAEDPDSEYITQFKNTLGHAIKRLNRYEKELNMIQ